MHISDKPCAVCRASCKTRTVGKLHNLVLIYDLYAVFLRELLALVHIKRRKFKTVCDKIHFVRALCLVDKPQNADGQMH